jgi:hypothetical protein
MLAWLHSAGERKVRPDGVTGVRVRRLTILVDAGLAINHRAVGSTARVPASARPFRAGRLEQPEHRWPFGIKNALTERTWCMP